MIRKILVPLDGSGEPAAALSVASSIASLSKAALTCLVIQDQTRFVHLSLPLAIAETLTGEAVTATPLSAEEMISQEERFEEELRRVRTLFETLCSDPQLQTDLETARGMPGEILKSAARGADLIVLPSRYREGAEPAELHALLRGITRPVLVVPEEAAGASRVVVAFDASAPSDRAVRAAAELALVMQLEELHVISVSSEAEFFQPIHHRLEQYIRSYGLAVKTAILKGRPDEAIRKYTRDVDATVLALGAFGSTAFSETIFGSTTAAVLRDADTAVLLVA